MKRLGRPLVVALFILVIAVTPLSAITSGGRFEYRYLPRDPYDWFGHTVVVDDRTGLVAGIGPARESSLLGATNVLDRGNWLHVQWWAGGCETHSRLLFQRHDAGFRIDVTSGGSRCQLLDLSGYSLVLRLWVPVDASNVEVRSAYDG